MMKILLFGKYGHLGWELRRTLATLGEVTALDLPEVDFTHLDHLPEIVQRYQPQVIVNAAAYTAVDRAESEPERADAVNHLAPEILASKAAEINAAFIHFSTDYVFDGTKGSPYEESDTPHPLNVYGESKLNGEKAVQSIDFAYLILRTSWVYSMRRESFVSKVLGWARQNETMRIVSDQIANPTWSRMLAEVISQLLARPGKDVVEWTYERRGLYHLAGSGVTSRLGWAQAILRYDPHRDEQIVQDLLPALTTDFPTPAVRPLFSALNCDLFQKTFNLQLPSWKDALQLAFNDNIH